MIIANSALYASLAIYHLKSNVHSWNNCYITTVIYPIGIGDNDDDRRNVNSLTLLAGRLLCMGMLCFD